MKPWAGLAAGHGPAAGLAALALVLGGAGCAGETSDPAPFCRDDAQCPPGHGCTRVACVARATGPSGQWSVEILPASESALSRTEMAGVVFGSDSTTLTVDRRVAISGSIERDPTDPGPAVASARVVVLVPSLIPGRREHGFETQGTARGATAPMVFTLPLSERTLGIEGRVQVLPTPPTDRAYAPWTADPVRVTSAISLRMPRTQDLFFVEGTVQEALQDAAPGYLARVLVADRAVGSARGLANERVVSSLGVSDDQGKFRVRVPRTLSADLAAGRLFLEVTPPEGGTPRPWLLAGPLADARLNVGMLRLPPTLAARVFNVPVQEEGTGARVAGVTLRFQAQVPGASGGEAFFRREGQTDQNGVAHVSLLPGAGGEAREYSVAVIPAPDSPLASRCVARYAVTGGGTAGEVGASIELAPRTALSGLVGGSDGRALSGVAVSATRLPGDAQPATCAMETGSASPMTTTDKAGRYRLLLDPGRYRIDFDPPSGAASTRAAEEPIAVTGEDRTLTRDVMLPGGVLVEGLLEDADGKAAGNCEVRAFGPAQGGRADLRGRARSGSDGRFRMVLPP